MAGGDEERGIDQTPTWAVAVVCAIIILVSIALEKILHKVGTNSTDDKITEEEDEAAEETEAEAKAKSDKEIAAAKDSAEEQLDPDVKRNKLELLKHNLEAETSKPAEEGKESKDDKEDEQID